MVIDMESKYLLAVIVIAAIATLSIGLASAHSNNNQNTMMDNSFGMGSMMSMMNMMGMMSGDFVHDQDDIDWMRKEMKEHMNFTDEEFDEMVEHCPMMRRK